MSQTSRINLSEEHVMAPADLLSLKIRCAVWPAVYSELLRALENKCVDVTKNDRKKQEAF